MFQILTKIFDSSYSKSYQFRCSKLLFQILKNFDGEKCSNCHRLCVLWLPKICVKVVAGRPKDVFPTVGSGHKCFSRGFCANRAEFSNFHRFLLKKSLGASRLAILGERGAGAKKTSKRGRTNLTLTYTGEWRRRMHFNSFVHTMVYIFNPGFR